MISYRHLIFGVAATLSAAAMGQTQASRPFDQAGPTGDNRAATGSPATQASPTQSGKDLATQKRPMKEEKKERADINHAPRHAPEYSTPGAPAENSAQDGSAK